MSIINPTLRKKVNCLIVTGANEAVLQAAVNSALEDIFIDPALYEVMDVKITGLTCLILYYQLTKPDELPT